MEELLHHGVIDDDERMGNTALHHAAMTNVPEAVNFLLEAGASVQDEDSSLTCSPLSFAVPGHAHGMVISLLEHVSKVHVLEHVGETPLTWAQAERKWWTFC